MVTHRVARRRQKPHIFQSPSKDVFSTQNCTYLALKPSADDDFSGILPIKIKYIISLTSGITKYRVDRGYYIYKLIMNIIRFYILYPSIGLLVIVNIHAYIRKYIRTYIRMAGIA